MAASPSDISLPVVIQFLQTENARFERDRNYWELEKAEMKTHIARLEGERKSNERIKDWYLRRLRMMEVSLEEERIRHDPSAQKDSSSVLEAAKQELGVHISKSKGRSKLEHTDPYLQIVRDSQDILRDTSGRDRSRKYLERCLSEITYLTAGLDLQLENTAPIPQHSGLADGLHQSEMDDMADQMPIRVPSPPADEPHKKQSNAEYADMRQASSHHDLGIAVSHELEPVVRISHVFDANGILQSESMESNGWSKTENSRKSANTSPLEQQGSLRGHLDKVNDILSINISNAWLVTASSDATIRVYRLSREEPLVTLRAHAGAVLCLAEDRIRTTSQQLCFFSAGDDGIIRHWSIPLDALSSNEGFESDMLPDLEIHGHAASICDLANDGDRLYTSSSDGTIGVWSPWSEAPRLFNMHAESLQNILPIALCILSDPSEDQIAVQYTNGTIVIFERNNGHILRQIPAKQASQLIKGKRLINQNNGQLLATQDSREILSFDSISQQHDTIKSQSIATVEDRICCFDKNPADNSFIVVCADGRLSLWDCESWQCIQEFCAAEDADSPSCVTWTVAAAGSEALVLGLESGGLSIFARSSIP